LPTIPGFSGTYDIIENVEVENAQDYGYGEIEAEGLFEGEYRFSVKLDVFALPICPDGPAGFASAKGRAQIYLYKRIYNEATPGVWVLINNENNYGISPVYEIGPLIVSTFDDMGTITYGQPKSLTTTFTIQAEEAEEDENDYEYAVGVRLISEFNNGYGTGPYVTIYGNDANYSYNQTYPFSPPTNPPVTNEYEYYTGVEEIVPDPIGYPSGVPYTAPDATRGIYYSSPTNAIALGDVDNGDTLIVVTLSTINQQAVPGLTAYITEPGGFPPLGFGDVVYVNPLNAAEITIQLANPWISGNMSLIGKNLQLITEGNSLTCRLYANTEEGTEIKRFYTDSNFTQKWIPPVANRYYNFITSKNYNPDGAEFVGGALKYSEFPYYCAFINGEGEVVNQPTPAPNIQTAWIGQNTANTAPMIITNYSYNVLYTEPPIP
jgi:hypothetical protein